MGKIALKPISVSFARMHDFNGNPMCASKYGRVPTKVLISFKFGINQMLRQSRYANY